MSFLGQWLFLNGKLILGVSAVLYLLCHLHNSSLCWTLTWIMVYLRTVVIVVNSLGFLEKQNLVWMTDEWPEFCMRGILLKFESIKRLSL